MDGSEINDNACFQDHLQLPGMAEQCATQTDAYLQVDGECIPVHAAVLTLQSPVFADMFKAANADHTTAHRRNGRPCMPLVNHNFADVCAAVKFLY